MLAPDAILDVIFSFDFGEVEVAAESKVLRFYSKYLDVTFTVQRAIEKRDGVKEENYRLKIPGVKSTSM
jgi:hypothetical protein